MKSSIFWDVTQRTLVVRYRRFRRIYRSTKKKNIVLGLLDPWRWDPIGCRETGSTLYKHPLRAKSSFIPRRNYEIRHNKTNTSPYPSRQPTPVITRYKAWVCGRSLAGIAGLNPVRGVQLCLLTVVYCQVELSASSWSLVQMSSSKRRVSECDREGSGPLVVVAPWGENKSLETYKGGARLLRTQFYLD
jgi:hypothetical protein